MTEHVLHNEKLRYLLVGAWNTAAGCAIFAVFYLLLHERVHYLLIGVLSHLLSVLNAWFGYRKLVFRSEAPWLAEYFRFNLSSLVMAGCNLGLLWILVDACGLHPILSQTLAVGFTVIAGFLVHRRFSFRTDEPQP